MRATPPREQYMYYEKTMDILEQNQSHNSLKRLFSSVSNDHWLWILTDGRRRIERINKMLPSLPEEGIQKRFTGKSGDETLKQAVGACTVFKEVAERHGFDFKLKNTRLLDFGCGWGRLSQVFLRDFEARDIIGVDVQADALDICRKCGFENPLMKVDPWPPTPIDAESIDLIIAYSVFSHLSEENHWAWLQEFLRILKPGGIVVATTRNRAFIRYAAELRKRSEVPPQGRGTANVFMNTDEILRRYDDGEYCFEVYESGREALKGFYGEACIPKQYIEKKWSKIFSSVGFLSQAEHKSFDQNVLIAKK